VGGFEALQAKLDALQAALDLEQEEIRRALIRRIFPLGIEVTVGIPPDCETCWDIIPDGINLTMQSRPPIVRVM
jgi:hypothetical protein